MNEARILIALVLAVGVVVCSGCGSSAGWRFEIGVAPVNAINNNYSLNAEPEAAEQAKKK